MLRASGFRVRQPEYALVWLRSRRERPRHPHRPRCSYGKGRVIGGGRLQANGRRPTIWNLFFFGILYAFELLCLWLAVNLRVILFRNEKRAFRATSVLDTKEADDIIKLLKLFMCDRLVLKQSAGMDRTVSGLA